jgi:peptidyl-prolyl cis-trans isomerase D
VQQIVFPTRAEAEAAAAAISSGKTFDDIVAERALTPADIDLGLVSREQLIDATIAEAAFGLALNTPSGIIDGAFGPVIVRVVTIEPAVVTSFDTVKDQLKTEIAAERAATEINALHDAIEDARAGGDTIPDIAERFGLPIVTVADVDAQGNDADGTPVPDLTPQLIAGVFDTDVGFPNAPIETVRGTYVWYDVTAITEPRERPLAEVRDRVVTAWKAAERQRLLDERAAEARDKVEGTRNIDQVATELGTTAARLPALKRTDAEGALSSEAIAAAFAGPPNDVVMAPGIDPMTTTILLVENSSLPVFDSSAPGVAQIREQVDSEIVGDLIGLYVGELQKKTDVRINEAVLQQVLGLTATP